MGHRSKPNNRLIAETIYPGAIFSDKYFASMGVAQQVTGGTTDYIPAWTMFLVPDTSEVKVLTQAEVDKGVNKPEWEEARPDKDPMKVLKEDMTCRYFLVPPVADTPSAFFAVGLPDDASEEPNMEFQDVVLTSSTGVTLAFAPDCLMKCRNMQAVAEEKDVALGFKLRVLVNCEPLRNGQLLTKPRRKAQKGDKRGPVPAITPSVVTKAARKGY